MLCELAAEEDGFLFFAKGGRSELGHSPLAHHAAGELRRALDVVASAGGDLAEENLLGDASAHQHG